MPKLIGYYTQELTTNVCDILNTHTPFIFTDSTSSISDETDSLYCEQDNIKIFIPYGNYSTYCILVDDGKLVDHDTKSLKVVIRTMKELYKFKGMLIKISSQTHQTE